MKLSDEYGFFFLGRHCLSRVYYVYIYRERETPVQRRGEEKNLSKFKNHFHVLISLPRQSAAPYIFFTSRRIPSIPLSSRPLATIKSSVGTCTSHVARRSTLNAWPPLYCRWQLTHAGNRTAFTSLMCPLFQRSILSRNIGSRRFNRFIFVIKNSNDYLQFHREIFHSHLFHRDYD